MFTYQDINFILDKEMQDKVFYKNKTFYGYDSFEDPASFSKLDYFYNTDFVYMSKISYFVRKTFKNINYEKLKKIFVVLNFIETCEIFNYKNHINIDYCSLINKNTFQNYNITQIYNLFIKNKVVNEILLKLIYIRNPNI